MFCKGEGGFDCNLEQKLISKDDYRMLSLWV
jgi:hypothetical protein